jgi:RNA polymerase sigma-70 factor (ECF subfamily)
MTDTAWIDLALVSARPQAMGALLRYFRSLDLAEEAFQEACIRALKTWPKNGPPRDPAAWLIFVGRNSGIDKVRRQARETALPPEELLSDLEDRESELADRLDGAHYRDDILRLLFVCSNPALPATQQIALALRIVSGLSVKQIARAFLVGEAAMEQRITRAKARVAAAGIPFETPDAADRAERLAAVATMIYLVFNEGYSATAGSEWLRPQLCEDALRLGRIVANLAHDEPEVHGLVALMEIQASRNKARTNAKGEPILLLEQNRALWD